MAEITFAPGAAQVAREVLQQFSLGESALAVLAIRWSPGQRENRRGPNGESIWETVETAGWVAEVAGFGRPKTGSTSEFLREVDGVHVFIEPSPRAREARFSTGRFLITSVEGGRFSVQHLET